MYGGGGLFAGVGEECGFFAFLVDVEPFVMPTPEDDARVEAHCVPVFGFLLLVLVS